MHKVALFEYVVIYQPRVRKDAMGNETQEPAKLLIPVTHVLCKDDKTAGMLAARAIPEEYLDKLDEVEIIVRPFG